MAAQQTEESVAPVPPLRPDPEIMDNAEGNEKILKHDQDAAIAYLKDEFRAPDGASAPQRAAG